MKTICSNHLDICGARKVLNSSITLIILCIWVINSYFFRTFAQNIHAYSHEKQNNLPNNATDARHDIGTGHSRFYTDNQ